MLAAFFAAALARPAGTAKADGDGRDACAAHLARGEELGAQGRLLAARAALDLCSRACSDEAATACAALRAEVVARVARVVVVATAVDGRVVEIDRLAVDDQWLPRVPLGGAVEVDPGAHRVEVRSGALRGAAEVVARPAEVHQLRVDLAAEPSAAEPAPDGGAPTAGPTGATIAWWSALGVGGAMGVGGLALTVLGHVKNGADAEACLDRGGCSADDAASRAASTERLWIAGGVIGGVGAVAAAVAAVGLGVAGTAPTAVPVVVPSRAGIEVGWMGSF